MSTAAAPNLPQVADVYDPDEVLPRNSPLLEPLRPTLQPSPSPASTLPSSPVSPPFSSSNKRPNRRSKARSSQGYAILVSYLDGHRRESAAYDDIEPPTSESEEAEDPGLREDSTSPSRDTSPDGQRVGGGKERETLDVVRGGESAIPRMSSASSEQEDVGAFDLKSLAAGALAAVTEPRPEPDAGPTPPITDNDVMGGRPQPAPAPIAIHTRRVEPLKDERNVPTAMPSPYSPRSLYSPRESGATPLSQKLDVMSPTVSIHSSSHSDGLPPLQLNSPRRETNGQTLPSIRSQLERELASSRATGNGLGGSHHGFTASPPAPMPRLPSLHQLGSPPIPPTDTYRDPLSPGHPLAGPVLSPGYYYSQPNGHHRPQDYAAGSAQGPGSDRSSSITAGSGRDRMSIDGTMSQTGAYVCKFAGCNAQPFQTQYLLNSHANVHSSARPHYCPVPGCPRGEGGKGFKRKNEMIRHGLVHDSPGYVCPFCPDREHRYPRPDNLQRHVRVHHPDKDKDDPLLREVLAQRPDGPNRGRRRRGAPS
ncbi:hypothetical protein VTI74DRAFT_8534 [Chaetomium olivicolor]